MLLTYTIPHQAQPKNPTRPDTSCGYSKTLGNSATANDEDVMSQQRPRPRCMDRTPRGVIFSYCGLSGKRLIASDDFQNIVPHFEKEAKDFGIAQIKKNDYCPVYGIYHTSPTCAGDRATARDDRSMPTRPVSFGDWLCSATSGTAEHDMLLWACYSAMSAASNLTELPLPWVEATAAMQKIESVKGSSVHDQMTDDSGIRVFGFNVCPLCHNNPPVPMRCRRCGRIGTYYPAYQMTNP